MKTNRATITLYQWEKNYKIYSIAVPLMSDKECKILSGAFYPLLLSKQPLSTIIKYI